MEQVQASAALDPEEAVCSIVPMVDQQAWLCCNKHLSELSLQANPAWPPSFLSGLF